MGLNVFLQTFFFQYDVIWGVIPVFDLRGTFRKSFEHFSPKFFGYNCSNRAKFDKKLYFYMFIIFCWFVDPQMTLFWGFDTPKHPFLVFFYWFLRYPVGNRGATSRSWSGTHCATKSRWQRRSNFTTAMLRLRRRCDIAATSPPRRPTNRSSGVKLVFI